MALCEIRLYSEALGMQTTVNVVIPQKNTAGEIGVDGKADREKYKCLYLLHGLSDDHSIWLRRTSIERYAQKYGICVVMPCAGRSFYTDMKYGGKYYTYIAKELPRQMQEFFNISDKREDNFIAGLSMGGYGALKIGLRECDRFCAAAGLSSVADIAACKERFKQTFIPIFGEELIIDEDDDILRLVEKVNGRSNKPRLYLGVGTEDSLYADNLKLKEKLDGLDFDFTYRESKGNHNWEFWDEYIQYILEWMMK